MDILEFGNKEKEKIILIHGFQLIWQYWEKHIEYFKKDYHVIVPIITGHNQNKKENFISFKEEAKEIEDYCINNFGEEICAVVGMSMGGVVAAILLENKRLKIKKILFDGSPLVSCSKIIKKIQTNFYLDVTHKTQVRDKKTIDNAKKIGLVPNGKMEEFLKLMDNLSEQTIVNCIDGIANYKFPNNINLDNTELYYYHGTKIDETLAKQSAKYIKKWYPEANVICFEGAGHCEVFSKNEKMLEEIIK